MREGIRIQSDDDGYWHRSVHDLATFLNAGTLEHFDLYEEYTWPIPGDIQLNLGPGQKLINGTIPLGNKASLMTRRVGDVNYNIGGVDWVAGERLPYETASVTRVFALHFLEHLELGEFYDVLHEVERVLQVGGLMFIVVPYGTTDFALRAPDHKLRFTENTWRTMFENDYAGDPVQREGYYIQDPASAPGWFLRERFSLIAGSCAQKMCLYTILEKVEEHDD